MLKKLTLAFFYCGLTLMNFSCKKDCHPRPVSSEAEQMQAFASNNGLTVMTHSSGLLYQIVDPGTGASVTSTSKIVITYTGKFLSGETFNQQTVPNDPAWALTDLVEGWRVGIPLIKAGGSIRLIVPSSMAYGCERYYAIPANSILYFEITLVDVQ